MVSVQITDNELSVILKRLLPVARENKLLTLLLILFVLVYSGIPSFQIPFLKYTGFRFTALMEQRAIENGLFFYPQQIWTDIEDVNPLLLKAIISMEDGKYFSHKGIDWKELDLSVRINERRGETVRGASTITMQTAKNLYLSTEKSVFRKLKELLITFRMEKELSKKDILESYINAAEWGDGIFGIGAAARKYFSTTPDKLTLDQCIRLAAVLPSPLNYVPNKNSFYVLRRSAVIRARISDVILFPGESK